jgi:hypothetical protein
MKINTSELKERALDWAVAKCAGIKLLDPHNNEWELCWTLLGDNSGDYYTPSSDWSQAGPIIEREMICTSTDAFGTWMAWAYDGLEMIGIEYGPTPLTAAMRCYVASKLGDTVDIPTELGETK